MSFGASVNVLIPSGYKRSIISHGLANQWKRRYRNSQMMAREEASRQLSCPGCRWKVSKLSGLWLVPTPCLIISPAEASDFLHCPIAATLGPGCGKKEDF